VTAQSQAATGRAASLPPDVERTAVLVGQMLDGTSDELNARSSLKRPPGDVRDEVDAAHLLFRCFKLVCVDKPAAAGTPALIKDLAAKSEHMQLVIDRVARQPRRDESVIAMLRQGAPRAQRALALLSQQAAHSTFVLPFIGALLALPDAGCRPGARLDEKALETVAAQLARPGKRDAIPVSLTLRQIELAPAVVRGAVDLGLLDEAQARFVLNEFDQVMARHLAHVAPGCPMVSASARFAASATPTVSSASAGQEPSGASVSRVAKAADVFAQLVAGQYRPPTPGPLGRLPAPRPIRSPQDASRLLFDAMSIACNGRPAQTKEDFRHLTGTSEDVDALVQRILAAQTALRTKPGDRDWLDGSVLSLGADRASKALSFVSNFADEARGMRCFVAELLKLPPSSSGAGSVDEAALQQVARQLAATAEEQPGADALARHRRLGDKAIGHACNYGLLTVDQRDTVSKAFAQEMSDLMRPAPGANNHEDRPRGTNLGPPGVPMAAPRRGGPAGAGSASLFGAFRRLFSAGRRTN
jgi:hypothetical protein